MRALRRMADDYRDRDAQERGDVFEAIADIVAHETSNDAPDDHHVLGLLQELHRPAKAYLQQSGARMTRDRFGKLLHGELALLLRGAPGTKDVMEQVRARRFVARLVSRASPSVAESDAARLAEWLRRNAPRAGIKVDCDIAKIAVALRDPPRKTADLAIKVLHAAGLSPKDARNIIHAADDVRTKRARLTGKAR